MRLLIEVFKFFKIVVEVFTSIAWPSLRMLALIALLSTLPMIESKILQRSRCEQRCFTESTFQEESVDAWSVTPWIVIMLTIVLATIGLCFLLVKKTEKNKEKNTKKDKNTQTDNHNAERENVNVVFLTTQGERIHTRANCPTLTRSENAGRIQARAFCVRCAGNVHSKIETERWISLEGSPLCNGVY